MDLCEENKDIKWCTAHIWNGPANHIMGSIYYLCSASGCRAAFISKRADDHAQNPNKSQADYR